MNQLGAKVLIQGTTYLDYSLYGYDAAGNRTYKGRPDVTEGYRYDALSRLTQVDRSTKRWRYQYDAVGNRTSEQIDNAVMTSTYDERNKLGGSSPGGTMRWAGILNEPGFVLLSSVTVNGQVARMLPGNLFEADIPVTAGTNTVSVIAKDTTGNVAIKTYQVTISGTGSSYAYDENGNLTQKVEGADTWIYEWTAENQLRRVLKNGVEQARFAYDPVGRRVEKVAAGVTSLFTYDGESILRQTAGMTTYKYFNGLGIDETLAVDNGATTTYLHADGLGSVVRATSSSGDVTFGRVYDAWGVNEFGGSIGGIAFTGREWDPETGLYYYRARYYDPKIGRFLSEDPIGFSGGINFYAYVGNNPVNWTDPFGLQLGGPNCKIGPAPPSPSPSPTPPPCLTESPCRCGTHEEFRWNLFWPCFFSGGQVTTVGTAAQGAGSPQTGMWGAARTGGSTGPPNAAPTNPSAPNNPGPATGGAMAGAAAVADFCHKAATVCVKD